MYLSQAEKKELKKELVASLRDEPEIRKIIVFGSFLTAEAPNDLDVAVIQNSSQAYLPLALKYRKKTRAISTRIALDILPLKAGMSDNIMLDAIAKGEVIYER